MTNKIKNYFENLKNDTKLRKQSIAIGSACLAVIVCAVAIPAGIHNNNAKQAAIARTDNTTVESVSETTTELTTVEETTIISEGYETTIVEADGTTKVELIEKTEPASAVQPTTNAPAANNGVTTTKKASSVKDNSGSASSTTKTATTKALATTSVPETTSGYNYNWNQSQVNSFVARSKAYGESIGLVWDDSFTLDNASWNSCISSRYSGNSENAVYEKMKSALNYKKNNGAMYFKIYPEYIDEVNGWEFTILWM